MITTTTASLAAPSLAERSRLAAQLGDMAVHARALDSLTALNAIEVGGTRSVERATGPLRVAAWNLERGRHPDAAAALISESGADVVLLSEMDLGMARTEQRHTTADLASRLGCTYAYGVEFVELAIGSSTDRRQGEISDDVNVVGLHGNAVLSRTGLDRPAIVRLTEAGLWFTEAQGEPRIGERMAVLATVADTVVGSVHLESSSDPDQRAAQMATLLDAIDTYADGRAVVIGGDLNTCSAAPADLYQPGAWEQLLAEDPARYVNPVPHEPLFEEAAAKGYDWEGANEPGTTTRYWSGSRRWAYAMRLDWILTRGVTCEDARTYPAVDGGDLDKVISDHDLVAVTVTPSIN